jgi:hypothetical protein
MTLLAGPGMQRKSSSSAISPETDSGCRIWLDGVGCRLLWFRDVLPIGRKESTARDRQAGDYRLCFEEVQDREPIHWGRTGSVEWIDADRDCRLNEEQRPGRTPLHGPTGIQLAPELFLEWNRPSPLSPSSVLQFRNRRSLDHVEGVVLFQQSCLLGPAESCHIAAELWECVWLLFAQAQGLWIRPRTAVATEAQPVFDQQILTLDDWRVRFERVP